MAPKNTQMLAAALSSGVAKVQKCLTELKGSKWRFTRFFAQIEMTTCGNEALQI